MKKILIGTILAALLLTTTSCGKKVECDFCGEMKHCEEKTVFGEVIHICDDCAAELS